MPVPEPRQTIPVAPSVKLAAISTSTSTLTSTLIPVSEHIRALEVHVGLYQVTSSIIMAPLENLLPLGTTLGWAEEMPH
jgi:hypothetical protein